jgi:hypothetical protein
VAGVVAFAVFGGAVALAVGAFGSGTAPPTGGGPSVAAGAEADELVMFGVRDDQHPYAILETTGGSVEGFGTSYCWTGDEAGLCADTIRPEDHATVLGPWDRATLIAGSTLAVTGSASTIRARLLDETFAPVEVLAFRDGRATVPEALGPGFLLFHATWPEGDREFYFAIDIVPEHDVVEMPDLVGLDDRSAMQALDELGLRWAAAYREHPDVPALTVVAQTPAAGAELASGSLVKLEIAATVDRLPPGAVDALACGHDAQVAFGGPDARILPGGALYITGNLSGFERTDEVVQVTSDPSDPETEWDGLWHVIRDGQVIAVVDWASLDGVACAGTGIAGA